MDLYQTIEAWSSLGTEDIKKDLEAHPELLSVADTSGNFLPHLLCDQKQYSLLLDLYHLKGDVIGLCQNSSKKTVLHLLARAKRADVFESVLQSCPGALSVTDNCGRLPGHLVLMHEAIYLAGILMAKYHSHFDLLLQDNDGESFLSLFNEKFFIAQKCCWEAAGKGHLDVYLTMKIAVETALKTIRKEKLSTKLRNICDIRIMKELKISVLHEIASDAPLTILEEFFTLEKSLSKYTDMSGMCPLMRTISSSKPDLTRIRALLRYPFELFDINNRSLLHHVLSNRSIIPEQKEAIFDSVCNVLSPTDMKAAFLAVDKTGHTVLSLATTETSVLFIEKVVSVCVTLVASWEEMYKCTAAIVENPLISALKSQRAEAVPLLLDAGFSLFQEANGQTSALFTLFRVFDPVLLSVCLKYCSSHMSDTTSALKHLLEKTVNVHTSRLSPAITPILESLSTVEYSPLSMLTYAFAIESITQHDTSGSNLPLTYQKHGDPSQDLLLFTLFALLSYREFLVVEVLLRIQIVAREFVALTSGNELSVLYAQEVCRHRADLMPQLTGISFKVVLEEDGQQTLAQFLFDIVVTRGKSYGHIAALFSLLDNASESTQKDIESALIKESSLFANVTYDLIVFFTNVLKLYRKYNPMWIEVLLAVFREDEIRGSRLIFSVLKALCLDGLVQLPMSLLSKYSEEASKLASGVLPQCPHCNKVTSTSEKQQRQTVGDVNLTDNRIELFFLTNALEKAETEVCDALANQGTTVCSFKDVLEILIRNLRWNAANKLYSNRPYRYMQFVREWFEGLPLCTCYIAGDQIEATS